MSELLKPRVLRNENSAFRPGSDKRNNVRKITDLCTIVDNCTPAYQEHPSLYMAKVSRQV
ncbi:hypothetical protein AC579_9302 [Pseudocercospora musae]|uniref:Uncharacterized protein n=1 Tax=Pseudocercospora musae TaxID=113226 RepID=A0A139I5M7_9PEZI|nr:hypothetical protein AC579_9302 [Pseudocercospora musae]KXT09832.1 hypothetical protein AC579_9302 [Pseudocercospora musae]